MRELFWCQNCCLITKLDCHGRCGMCGSEAVDRAVHGPSVEELEKLYERSK
jgi:hypothetical protein